MSRYNLVKQFVTVEAEEKRVIDTEETIRRREEQAAAFRKVSRQPDADTDSFVSGLYAEEVELPQGEEDESGGNVIKASQEEVELVMGQAREDAQAILDQANEEAARMLAAAKADAEAQKKNILDQASQQGYEDGQAKAMAEADKLRKEFQDKARQLEEHYQQLIDELEPRFVDAITDIYEHVFQVELGANRAIVEYLISNTMHKLEGGHDFLIHVSKEDYSHVSMHKQEILSGTAPGAGNVEVVEDLTLTKNECLIETDGGIFDCGLGTQLAELKRKLMLLAWSKEE